LDNTDKRLNADKVFIPVYNVSRTVDSPNPLDDWISGFEVSLILLSGNPKDEDDRRLRLLNPIGSLL
jgi:hypothetical protein